MSELQHTPPPEAVFRPDRVIATMLDAAATSLEYGSLYPYRQTGNALALKQLRTPTRTLSRNPGLQPILNEALALDSSHDTMIAAADLLGEARLKAQMPHEPPVKTLLSFLSLANEMGIAHIGTNGQDTPNDRLAALQTLVLQRLVRDVPNDQVIDFLVSSNFIAGWFKTYTKGLHNLQTLSEFTSIQLQCKAENVVFAESLPGADTREYSDKEIAQDSTAVAEAFREIRSNQQYGLKSGYRPYRLGGSIIIGPPVDPGQLSGSIHPLANPAPAVAEITHSTEEDFTSLQPTVTINDSDLITVRYEGITNGTVMMRMDASGELYADHFCSWPLVDIYRAQGKYAAYRQLQAEIIADYFDMTRSATVVQQIAQQAKAPNIPSVHTSKQEPLDTLTQLVIPRIAAERQLLANTEQTAEQPADTTGRSVRLHGVTWHRRKLPEGWRASPQALSFATQAGITLKPGETFVKAHKRGNEALGKIVGHNLIKVDSNSVQTNQL